jgi:hypothetical protein
LRDHIFKRFHDARGFVFLVVREDASHNDDNRQDNAKVQVIIWGFLIGSSLDGVGDEAKDCTKPEKHGKASKQVLAKLDPFRGGWGWGQSVQAIFLLTFKSSILGESAVQIGVEALAEFLQLHLVDVKLKLLLELVEIFP